MPLCGNGRINTKNEYLTHNSPRITVSKEQLLHITVAPEQNTIYQVAILADEECDDGNRIDFDGCSADCMYMDLMTSACELAVEQGENLVYEDIMYDKVRKTMVISTLQGIYSLEGDTSLKPKLLASKDFPVDHIFRLNTEILLYSASEQTLWRLPDGANNITVFRTLPLSKRKASQSSWKPMIPRENGPMMFRDETAWVYLPLPSEPGIKCNVSQMVNLNCYFLQEIEQNFWINCGYELAILIGANVCQAYHRSDPLRSMEGTLWSDVFQTVITQKTELRYFSKVEQRYSPEFAEGDTQPNAVIAVEGYTPIGGFFEMTINSPRKLNSSNQIPLIYYLGEPSLWEMALTSPTSGPGQCGKDTCLFDNDVAYDITQEDPLKHATGTSWNAVLQEEIDKIAPPTTSLYDLKMNSTRYRAFLHAFAKRYEAIVEKQTILDMVKHPVSHGLWALQKNKIVEISKTGIKIKRSDGKCIPSGAMLCDKCMWAPSGAQCRPCSENQSQSFAWRLSCQGCDQGGTRRLLNSEQTTIYFTVMGERSQVMALWPNAVPMPNSAFSVKVATEQPVVAMKKIKLQLLMNQDQIRVVIPPYVNVYLNGTAPMKMNEEDKGPISWLVILFGSIALVGIVLLIILFWFYNSKHGHSKKRNHTDYHQVNASIQQ